MLNLLIYILIAIMTFFLTGCDKLRHVVQSLPVTTTTTITTTVTPAHLTSIEPNSGSTAGGLAVGILGSNFTGATSVVFGGVEVSPIGFIVVDDNTIHTTTPPHSAGVADVFVFKGSVPSDNSVPFTYS